jgi:hypothetical protein
MKKALVLVAAVVLVAWVVSWFRAEDEVADASARPWPGDLGTLSAAPDRYPPQHENEAARKLTQLAAGFAARDDAVMAYVRQEIARAEPTIAEPPALLDVSAIRELLLREPVVWERRDEIGDADASAARAVQMRVARALVASALTKARANDPAAWEDLYAVWKLARSLDGHPQMMAQTAGLTMGRMINGVAWKMPLPAPAWLPELRARDHVRPLLEAFQVQTESYRESGAQLFPTKWLATSVEHDRLIAQELFKATRCEVNARANEVGTDLTSVWRRAFRYRAEREATANALRVREGKPIETGSGCSDGAWSFDGETLRFAKPIPVADPRDISMPLTLHVRELKPLPQSAPAP